MALLPDFQLPEILHGESKPPSASHVYLQLNTDNCQLSRRLAC
jgi:hypothetical protein